MGSSKSLPQAKKVRLQLSVDSAFVRRLDKFALQFRSKSGSFAEDLLADSLEMRSKLEEWYAWRIGQFFTRKVFGKIQPAGKTEYLQVYVDSSTAEKLERFATGLGQTVAKCGGMILECAVNDEHWILEAALRIVKGVKSVQSADLSPGKKARTT